jgi:hypothetical protein
MMTLQNGPARHTEGHEYPQAFPQLWKNQSPMSSPAATALLPGNYLKISWISFGDTSNAPRSNRTNNGREISIGVPALQLKKTKKCARADRRKTQD